MYFSRARAQIEPLERFSRFMAQATRFRAMRMQDDRFIYLFIYPRRKDHVATYTVGKSTYIISTYTTSFG